MALNTKVKEDFNNQGDDDKHGNKLALETRRTKKTQTKQENSVRERE